VSLSSKLAPSALRLRSHDQTIISKHIRPRRTSGSGPSCFATNHLGPGPCCSAARSVRPGLHHRVFNVHNLILAGGSRRSELALRVAARRKHRRVARMLLAESFCCAAPAPRSGVVSAQPIVASWPATPRALGPRARPHGRHQHALGGSGAGHRRCGDFGVCPAPAVGAPPLALACRAPAYGSAGSTSPRQQIFAVTQIAASFVLCRRKYVDHDAGRTAKGTDRARHAPRLAINVPAMSYGKTPQQVVDFYKESIRRIDALPGVNKTLSAWCSWRDAGFGSNSPPTVMFMPPAKRILVRRLRLISPGFFPRWAFPSSPP